MSFILRKKGVDQWAAITPKGREKLLHVSWGSIDKASAFETPEALEKTFFQAILDMKKSAQTKADQINAKGGIAEDLNVRGAFWYSGKKPQGAPHTDFGAKIPLTSTQMIARIIQRAERYNYRKEDTHLHYQKSAPHHSGIKSTASAREKYVKLSELKSQQIQDTAIITELFERYGFLMRQSEPSEHLPAWCQSINPKEFLKKNTVVERQAQSENFLQAQTTYFVRSKEGWLGLKKGSLTFLPQMQQAQLFFDEQAAKSALQSVLSAKYGSVSLQDCSFIKNQLVITQVSGADPKSSSWMSDYESAKLASACDALCIEEVIQSAVDARQKAHEQQQHTKNAKDLVPSSKPRARL